MAESLEESLKTYRIHLEQVESALNATPDNEELLKLKADLEEVINLTATLKEAESTGESSQEVAQVPTSNVEAPQHKWSVGDVCLSQYSQDKQWYKCRIDAITSDGMVAITYEDFDSTDVCKMSALHDVSEAASLITSGSSQNPPRKRHIQEAQRQQQKKKKLKKFDRQKMIDEAHEQDKVKWQQFANKSKRLKGVTKKSIFATPDAVNGRVGIGTCGIGGRPMTDFTHAEKRKKGV